MARSDSPHSNGNSTGVDAPLNGTPCNPKEKLIVIGGREQKEGHRPILELLAKGVGSGKIIVATLAAKNPNHNGRNTNAPFASLALSTSNNWT